MPDRTDTESLPRGHMDVVNVKRDELRQPQARVEQVRAWVVSRRGERTRLRRARGRQILPVAKNQRFLDPELVATPLQIGTSPLTPRETDVLRAAAAGGTTDEIGTELYLSSPTVRNYLSNAISKLDARNRIDAIRIARDAGSI